MAEEPKVKSESSEEFTVATPFDIIDHETLPANAPMGHPHVLKIPKVQPYVHGPLVWPSLRLADGVATVLHHYNESALKTFFDSNVQECTFLYVEERGRTSSRSRFVIERKGNQVIAGHYRYSDPVPTFEQYGSWNSWQVLVKAEIEPSGYWNEYYGAGDKPGLGGGIGSSKFEDGKSAIESYKPDQEHPEGRDLGIHAGEKLAVDMLKNEIWHETKIMKKVTWTAS